LRHAAIDSFDALAIVIASITRLLKLSLFFWLSTARFARFADARGAASSHSVDALPAKACRAAFHAF
jgi:hypothetical protein